MLMKATLLLTIVLTSVLNNAVYSETSRDRLVIADQKGDWGVLAPYLHIQKGPGYLYTSFLFDSLVWKNQSGEYTPMLANSWQVDKEYRCYDFTLNKEAKWHDGKPFTAEDVVFSINYMKEHLYQYASVIGVDSVTENAGRVSICNKESNRFFIEKVASVLPILPKHIYEKVGDPTRYSNVGSVIGTGPYRLEKYDKAQGFYSLARNEDWYLGTPKYKNVIITKLSPQMTAQQMFKGHVDVASIPYNLVGLYKENDVKIISSPSNHPVRMLFERSSYFSSIVARQAVAYAIDKIELAELSYQGHATVARPALRQGLPLGELHSYQYDPVNAAGLLTTEGWRKSKSGEWFDKNDQKVTVSLIASSTYLLVSKVLAKQLEAFGFDVDVRILPDVPFLNALSKKQYDIALVSQSHQGNLDRFRLMLVGEQDRGDQYYENTQLPNLFAKLNASTEEDEIERIFSDIEYIYNQELPSLPLLNPVNYSALSDDVEAGYTHQGVAMGIPMVFNKTSIFFDKPSDE